MAARFAASLRRKLFRGRFARGCIELASDLEYFQEHLGLISPQNVVTGREPVTPFMRAPPWPQADETQLREDALVADPLSDGMLNLWYTTARSNREIFSQIFRTVPTDNVRNWDQYKVGRTQVPGATELTRLA